MPTPQAPDGSFDALHARQIIVPRSRDDASGAGELTAGESTIRPFVTVINNNGDPGYRIFVSDNDPALTFPVSNGDIWIDTTP